MTTMERTTVPGPSLVELASEMDREAAAITALVERQSARLAELDRQRAAEAAEMEAELHSRQGRVRSLRDEHERIFGERFASVLPQAPAASQARRRGAPARTVDPERRAGYAEREAKRQATLKARKREAAARTFAEAHDLHCPVDEPVPAEVFAAFDQDQGYQG
jgi:hypothetical protein